MSCCLVVVILLWCENNITLDLHSLFAVTWPIVEQRDSGLTPQPYESTAIPRPKYNGLNTTAASGTVHNHTALHGPEHRAVWSSLRTSDLLLELDLVEMLSHQLSSLLCQSSHGSHGNQRRLLKVGPLSRHHQLSVHHHYHAHSTVSAICHMQGRISEFFEGGGS